MSRGVPGFRRWLRVVPAGAAALMTVAGCASAASVLPQAGGTPSASVSSGAVSSGAVSSSGPVSPAPSVSASPSATGAVPAIPAAILQAVTGGGSERITVVSSPGSVLAHPAQSQAAALRTALAQEPHGSRILGLTLARVRGFGFGTDMTRSQLAWLVSVDPYGGAYGGGGPACGLINYDVEVIDPGTAQWLAARAGRQPGLAPLPVLGPTPRVVQPSPSCGAQVPRPRLGTPAAN